MFRKLAVLLVVASLGVAGARGASLLFPARNDADAGVSSGFNSRVATVDADGDGIADFAVVTVEQGLQPAADPTLQEGIQVFAADQRGLFVVPQTVITVPLNSFPGAVVAGDFDNDGQADDFAVALEDLTGSVDVGMMGETTNGGVLVYTLDAVGTFNLFATLDGANAQPGFTGLAAGDLGGGPGDDIVVVNSQSNSFSVFLADATSQFVEAAGSPVGACGTPVAVATGQLDPTPRDDVVILCDPIGSSDVVQTWKNSGAGQFMKFPTQPTPPTLTDPDALVIADLNNDGSNDVAIANSFLDAGTLSGTVTLLQGDGLGGFVEFSVSGVGVGANPVSIDAADLDGDGALDLVTANQGDEDISILSGTVTGTGMLAQPTYVESFFAAGFPPVEAHFANLDGQGNADVVVTNANESTATLSSFLGDANGLLHAATRVFPVDAGNNSQIFGANALAMADFSGDGIADLAVANAGDDTVSIFAMTPAGAAPFTLLDVVTLKVGDLPFDLLAQDVNGDTSPDLLVLLSPDVVLGTVATFFNNGSGNFPATPNFAPSVGTQPWTIARADLDGDTIPDLAVTNLADQTVTLLKGLNNGDTDPTPLATLDITDGSPCVETQEEPDCDPNGLALADINGDGDVDMVVSRFGGVNGGTLRVFNNDGSGVFTGGQILSSADPFADPNDPTPPTVNHQTVFLADLDGANGPDIVAVGLVPDDLISVFLNDGVGAFAAAPGSPFILGGMDVATPDGPRNAVVTDVNGDGVPDLVVTGFNSNNLAVVLGAGDGTFFPARAAAYGTTQGPIAVGAADINADGLVDLVAVGVNDDVALLDSGLDERTDMDGSARTDGFDLAALARLFGISASDPSYDFYLDIDADGSLDGDDLNLLTAFFGLTFF
ncbi:MAG: FG-GAP repeat domain-containing protein [Acidobacteriota bacterium]